MATRARKADLKVIETLLDKHGWTHNDLADKAGCSCRTVDNAMGGNVVLISTFKKLAKAFGVTITSLFDGNQEALPVQKMVRVVIVTTLEYHGFDEPEKREFLKMVAEKLSAIGPITVQDVQQGSTIITLEMEEEDAREMIALFARGELEKLSVTDLSVPDIAEPFLGRATIADHHITESDCLLINSGDIEDDELAVVMAHLQNCDSCQSSFGQRMSLSLPFRF